MEARLPLAATVVAMFGGRKPRAARWIAFCLDCQSVVALEYALIAGVMVFVVFTVSSPFATALEHLFDSVANQL